MNLSKKCLAMVAKIAEKKDDYKKSCEQVGKGLKLGAQEASTNRTKVEELVRFNTSRSGDDQNQLEGTRGRREIDGNKLKSTTKTGLNLEDEDKKKRRQERLSSNPSPN